MPPPLPLADGAGDVGVPPSRVGTDFLLFAETRLLLDVDLAVNLTSVVPDRFPPGEGPFPTASSRQLPPTPSRATLSSSHGWVCGWWQPHAAARGGLCSSPLPFLTAEYGERRLRPHFTPVLCKGIVETGRGEKRGEASYPAPGDSTAELSWCHLVLSGALASREQQSSGTTFSQAQHKLGSKPAASADCLLFLLQTLVSTVPAVVLWRAFILPHAASLLLFILAQLCQRKAEWQTKACGINTSQRAIQAGNAQAAELCTTAAA